MYVKYLTQSLFSASNPCGGLSASHGACLSLCSVCLSRCRWCYNYDVYNIKDSVEVAVETASALGTEYYFR